jgi:hypothetical protein
MDWIGTVGKLELEKEGARESKWPGKLNPRVISPSLLTLASHGKASSAALGVYTPCTAYTANDKGLGSTSSTAWVNYLVTQEYKVKRLNGKCHAECGCHINSGIMAVKPWELSSQMLWYP